jgi:gliding motility-associated lipoprotein GldH
LKIISFLFICLIALGSCKQIDIYEKNENIPEQEWDYSFKPSYEFQITDTTSYYNIFIVLRHTDAYEYNNIWLNLSTKVPGDSVRSRNLQLILGNDAEGWEGKGMSDIYEVRKLVTQRGPERLSHAGTYTFSLSQVMRDNPLKHILSVGVRVEKVAMQ